jgi:hypothetical protein
MRAKKISTFLAALLLAASASAASAQDYCVTCTGPDAKYRCIIGGDASISARSSRGQMLCITQLAQRGGHASCSVSRSATEPCEGQVKTVMFPAGEPNTPQVETLPPAAPAAAPGAAPPPVAPSPLTEGAPPPPEAPQPAPATVGEFAQKTAKDTGEGLKKAGDAVTTTVDKTGKAIGHAASKTWKCLTSFFGDC